MIVGKISRMFFGDASNPVEHSMIELSWSKPSFVAAAAAVVECSWPLSEACPRDLRFLPTCYT